MAIDMHAHWRPAELIDALRLRTTEPRVFTNDDGVEVYKARNGEVPVARLSITSKHGWKRWIARASAPLCCHSLASSPGSNACRWMNPCRWYSSTMTASRRCALPMRAGLPLYAPCRCADVEAAAAEFDRAMTLPGMVGAQAPGNAFLTYKEADAFRPVIAAAHRNKAAVLIHFAPLPGDVWPRVPKGPTMRAVAWGRSICRPACQPITSP